MSSKSFELKLELHPRNKHRGLYDFHLLISGLPELAAHVKKNKFGNESINFADPKAVKALNKALLKQYYKVDFWEIPDDYLCPPVPGRVDYIHYAADLLESDKKLSIRCLDIGTGANLIYPIVGVSEYNWNFIGTDIDPDALYVADEIIERNPFLKNKVDLRIQANSRNIFKGIILKDEFFDLTICNPPFHASAAEANASSLRKTENLKGQKNQNPILNFSGRSTELWCDGGEKGFLLNMIYEVDISQSNAAVSPY